MKNINKRNVSAVICVLLLTANMLVMNVISDDSDNPVGIDENLVYSFNFEEPELKDNELYNEIYTDIDLSGTYLIGDKPGTPIYPVLSTKILIPKGMELVNLNFILSEETQIDVGSKGYDLTQNPIVPYQKPLHFGEDMPDSITYDYETYNSNDPYPHSIYESLGIDYCRGYAILSLNIYPTMYLPADGELFYYPNVVVEIGLSESGYVNEFLRDSPTDRDWVESLVMNPEVAQSYNAPVFNDVLYAGGLCDPSDNGGNGYDYVVICRESLEYFTATYNWNDFINRKLQDGLDTIVVSVENITACSDYWNSTSLFNDSQAKIREFCRDAYQDWGISYVLIAGDHDGVASIPRRLMDTTYEGNIESDIYWSNLDNDFNNDGDSDWGEEADSGFDLYSELFIGSIPCDEPIDISNWLTKSFYYADSLEKDYLENAAFYGGDTGWTCQGDDFIDFTFYGTSNWLGPDPENDGPWPFWLGFLYGFDTWNSSNPGMEWNNSVRWTAEPPNPGWLGGSESAAIAGLKAAISNDDVTVLAGIAHANSDMSLDVGSSSWESEYHNTKPFFIHDYGCHCGDMSASSDGVLHSMLFHSDVELAFACVYNTCYGWGNLGGTNSSSALQQKLFFDYLFNLSKSGGTINWQMGKAQAWSKDVMAPTINWDPSYGTWRAIIQGCLLFGDPAQNIKPPLQPDHEIVVHSLDVMPIVPHGETQYVSATVTNAGKNNESNILVNFTTNGTVVDSTVITVLNTLQSEIVTFSWDPAIGTYLVGIDAHTVPDENLTYNNAVNRSVQVIPAPDIWINPLDFVFNLNEGVTTMDVLTVGNEAYAEAALTFSISYSGNTGWLSVVPDTGSVPIGGVSNLDVMINTSGMAEGSYVAYIVISCNDLDEPVLYVPVDLSVVFADDVGAVSVNYPTGPQSAGSYVVNATVENFGSSNKTGVIVNCSIYEGGIGATLSEEDFYDSPTNWTITHVEGTAWTWDSTDKRMENTYVGYPNSGYLDSPIIDCSGITGVNLSFWHYWRADYSYGTQDGYVRGSVDGGMTYPYLIDEFHHLDPNEETAVKFYNIPWADAQSSVRIRFDIENNNDWYWYIDDFNVSSQFVGDVIYSAETTVDVNSYEQNYAEFTPAWTVNNEGFYAILVTTMLPGDQDTTNDNAVGSLEVLPSDLQNISILSDGWNFVSLTFNQSVDLSNLIIKYNGIDYNWSEAIDPVNGPIVDPNIYGWDRPLGIYLQIPDYLFPGYGYWIYSYNDCELWAENIISFSDGYITELEENWNIMGIPDNQPTDISNLIVQYNGMDYTWSEAIDPVNGPIVDPNIYGWDNNQGIYHQVTNTMEPGCACWIYSYSKVTIRLSGILEEVNITDQNIKNE